MLVEDGTFCFRHEIFQVSVKGRIEMVYFSLRLSELAQKRGLLSVVPRESEAVFYKLSFLNCLPRSVSHILLLVNLTLLCTSRGLAK